MNLYNELTNCNSVLFKSLTNMDKEAEKLEAKTRRIRELNHSIVYLIQTGKITDIEDVNCALSWLYNSDLSVEEIMNTIFYKTT